MMLFPLARIRPDHRYAWRGPSILIVDHDGWAGRHPLSGYFFRQARFLSDLRLEINGNAPYPCSLAEVEPNELEATYIFPEVDRGGGGGSGSGGQTDAGGLVHRVLDLRLRYRVRAASVEATLWITNRWQSRAGVELGWVLSADYATMDEATFDFREQKTAVNASACRNGVEFRHAHGQLPFTTRIQADGARWHWAGARLAAQLELERQRTQQVRLVVRAVDFQNEIDAEGESRREAKLAAWQKHVATGFAHGETPLIELTNRSLRDLGSFPLLEGAEDEWLIPGAGVPLYGSLWGRDALTAGWQAGLFDGGAMLTDVLNYLTRTRGVRVDPERDEEPGRIINQAKSDPLSRLDRVPFARYYADFASPFMFIIALGNLFAITGRRDLLERNWDAATGVLDWARQYGDRDGDGYLEYQTQARLGPRHQGWKDSENAVVDETGLQIEPPIASCEVQGYYYASLQFMAAFCGVMGDRGRAWKLWHEARELKRRFNRDFWMEDEGYVAFGLGADKRPIRALTSNGAHCLPTGIIDAAHVPRLVRRMFEPDLFSGWGIRTLSSGNPAYNPLDYHLGSVWPVENATILLGLRRYGLNHRALELARALYDLARLWPAGRIPECVGGYSRDEMNHPGAYPKANVPQAWNQSVFPLVVQSLLGIVPCAPLNLLLVDPILPSWLPDIELRNLRIGESTVSLRFHREPDGRASFDVTEKRGPIRVVRQPWVESSTATPWERLGALAESVLPHGPGGK